MSTLVRWLPQIAEATADDIARFGPQAARVRTLLEFLPKMSGAAARISKAADDAAWDARNVGLRAAHAAAYDAAWDAAIGSSRGGTWGPVLDDATSLSGNAARGAAKDAAWVEVVSDLVNPASYRTLTNPLATGRAFDVLRPRAPENFLDVVRGLSERRLVTQPIDVLGARTIARAPKPERQALLEVINAVAGDTGYADTGYDSLAELIEAARLLQ